MSKTDRIVTPVKLEYEDDFVASSGPCLICGMPIISEFGMQIVHVGTGYSLAHWDCVEYIKERKYARDMMAEGGKDVE